MTLLPLLGVRGSFRWIEAKLSPLLGFRVGVQEVGVRLEYKPKGRAELAELGVDWAEWFAESDRIEARLEFRTKVSAWQKMGGLA
jgi:hypothetical protein